MNELRLKKPKTMNYVESGLELWTKMSWITNKVGFNDQKKKMDKFKLQKIVLGIVWGDQFLYTALKFDYKFGSWLLSVSFFIPWSPSLSVFFFFYPFFPFHLYPTRASQMFGVDPCPISTFLKSSCSSCKNPN